MVSGAQRAVGRLQKLNILFYLLMMLGLFPLVYYRQYEQIGAYKYSFFWYSSMIFLGIWASIFVLQLGVGAIRRTGSLSVLGISPSFMDAAVLGFGICVLISFGLSDYKDYAGKGAPGWEMGLYAQLIFIALYFVTAHNRTWIRPVLTIHILTSGLVFALGFLHRFNIDPLEMYPGLTILQKKEFLSTIGQATWYSSYVCTVFPVGLMVYFFSKKMWIQVVSVIYVILSFATLVTQNSDSAFLGLMAVLLLLGLFSVRNWQYLLTYLRLMTILWGTFGGVGILQRMYEERMIPLDSLSLFFSQSILPWICFGSFLVLYLAADRVPREKRKELLPLIQKGYLVFLTAVGVGIILVVAFIILNTKGLSQEWLGFGSDHPYLFFDQNWGNNRGSSWSIAWQEWWRMSWPDKLFGAGPDCFAPYIYSIPEREAWLRGMWGNLTLTNAHNEYLNHLICYGIVGTAAWLTVLVGGIVYFYRKADRTPGLLAVALCLASYLLHNLFCYQQICCTPFVFLFLGVGEGLTKWGKSPTIIENK